MDLRRCGLDPDAPWARLTASLFIAALLALALLGAFVAGSGPVQDDSMQLHRYMRGEPLLHGLASGEASYAMPLSGVWESAVEVRQPPARRRCIRGLQRAASLLLVFALGTLLHSPLGGLFAVWITQRLDLLGAAAGAEDRLFAALVLLAACGLAWSARRPGPRAPWVRGLAVGITLLARSTLFLLPPLLAWRAWRSAEPGTRPWRRILPVLLLPAALLVPWIAMNAALHGRFIPFEDTRADNNVIAGAMGVVSTIHGDDLARIAGIPEDAGVLSWAAANVLRHPLRFSVSFIERALWTATAHPFLLLAAVFSSLLFRGREEAALTGTLAAYFFAVHWLMGIELRYFAPIWPVAAAMASAPLAHLLTRRGGRGSEAAAGCILAVCMIPVLSASATALIVSGSYPFRLSPERTALERALAREPDNPWLWAQRARTRLRSGEPGAAAGDFARALRLDPRSSRELDLAWALAAKGGPGADLVFKLRLQGPDPLLYGDFIRTAVLIEEGRGQEAAASFARTMNRYRLGCGADADLSALEERVTEELCSPDRTVPERIIELLGAWPPGRRLDLLEGLCGLPGAGAAIRVRAARLAASLGESSRARRLLARAEETARGRFLSEQIAGLHAALQSPQAARGSARGLADSVPESRPSLLSIARSAALSGDRAGALKALSEARRSGISADALREAADIYLELERWEDAIAALRPLARDPRFAARALRDRGICRRMLGETKEAAQDLSAALRLDPRRVSTRLSLAAVFSQMGREGEARGVLREGLLVKPRAEEARLQEKLRKALGAPD